MSKSVVIGGAGFVGSWLVKELLKETQDEIVVIDNLISSERWNIPDDERIQFILGSAGDTHTLLKVNGDVSSVYHLACYHGNQSSIADPMADFENNLRPTITVLDWVEKVYPAARVVYTGAGCAVAPKTWDTPEGVPEVDETPLLHDSPYSISKVAGEMYSVHYAKQRGLDVVRVRFQNAFGPGEILGAGQWRGTEHTIWRNVIPTFIWRALQNQDLVLFGEIASRDFVYVEDLARGVLLARKYGEIGEVYNLASGKEIFIADVASLILKRTASSSKINLMPKREWDNSGRRFGSVEKSREKLGFEAKISLETGIERTLEWFKENSEHIQRSIERHL